MSDPNKVALFVDLENVYLGLRNMYNRELGPELDRDRVERGLLVVDRDDRDAVRPHAHLHDGRFGRPGHSLRRAHDATSRTAAALGRLGYRSAFANQLRGAHAVQPGDDPYWLKRLPNRYIFRLPGRGRRLWR